MSDKQLARTAMLKDYYAVLGVSQSATQDEIRTTYRQLVLRYHPDVSNEPDAEERFKEINEAYSMLSDPEKRKVYDIFLAMVTGGIAGFTPNQTSATSRAGPRAPRPSQSYTYPTPPPGPDNYTTQPSPSPRPSDTRRPTTRQNRRTSRPFPPTWAMLLILLGFLIVAAVGASALLSLQRSQPVGGAETLEVSKLSTFTSPPTISPDMSVIQENGVPITAMVPTSIALGNRQNQPFRIIPVMPEDGRWPIPAESDNVAVWVYGTVVNYVIGMPYSNTIESLLAGLTSGDRLTLTLSNGNVLVFSSSQAERVAANDTSPMAQTRPGLTLVMLGSMQTERLVIRARYLPEEGLTSESGQKVDDLTVKVLDTNIIDADEKRYFVVEYQVNNQSTLPVDPNLFNLTLQEGTGLLYQPNAEATAQGQAGALDVLIPPGSTVQGSAGYFVPQDMQPPLTWIFRADPASSESARFVLPYELPPPSPPQPNVEITTAFVDNRQNLIVVNGVIHNLGESRLTVEQDNVQLTSSAGSSSLQTTNPPWPWVIESSSEQNFELQFSRPPNVQSVLLDILGFTFELQGLP